MEFSSTFPLQFFLMINCSLPIKKKKKNSVQSLNQGTPRPVTMWLFLSTLNRRFSRSDRGDRTTERHFSVCMRVIDHPDQVLEQLHVTLCPLMPWSKKNKSSIRLRYSLESPNWTIPRSAEGNPGTFCLATFRRGGSTWVVLGAGRMQNKKALTDTNSSRSEY